MAARGGRVEDPLGAEEELLGAQKAKAGHGQGTRGRRVQARPLTRPSGPASPAGRRAGG